MYIINILSFFCFVIYVMSVRIFFYFIEIVNKRYFFLVFMFLDGDTCNYKQWLKCKCVPVEISDLLP